MEKLCLRSQLELAVPSRLIRRSVSGLLYSERFNDRRHLRRIVETRVIPQLRDIDRELSSPFIENPDSTLNCVNLALLDIRLAVQHT